MLNRRLTLGCFVLLVLATAPVVAKPAQVSRNQVNRYLESALEEYASDNSPAWEDRMYRALAARRDPDAAARTLAQQDGLSVADEKALLALWIAHAELRDSERREVSLEEYASQRKELERKATDTVAATRYAPLAIEIAVRIIGEDRS